MHHSEHDGNKNLGKTVQEIVPLNEATRIERRDSHHKSRHCLSFDTSDFNFYSEILTL